jgi:hypothetical protein
MEPTKPVLKITTEEWQAKQARGMAALVGDRPYIVMMHESTKEPVYQPVDIVRADPPT